MTNDRRLQPSQRLFPLIALGVGAVISGDFFGWNYGLARGGFGGLLIATILVAFMYICVSFSLAELASMYPSAEGTFAFVRRAFGPFVGGLGGLSESLEYILLVPVIVTGLGDHLHLLFNISNRDYVIIWWLLLTICYLIVHLIGPRPTFWSNTIITCLSLLTLLAFWIGCISVLMAEDAGADTVRDRMFNDPVAGESAFLPNGVGGIFTSLVFAAWFFIAIEEVPLAGEDALEPKRTIPQALIWSILTLTMTAFLTAILSVSVPGGAYNIANAEVPLVRSLVSGIMDTCVQFNNDSQACRNAADAQENFVCEWRDDVERCYDLETALTNTALAWKVVIEIGTLIGLLTSCHAIIFAGGRQLMSLTRNGVFPTYSKFDRIINGTPRIALTVNILLSLLICLIVYYLDQSVDFLVGLSVVAGCLSYIISMSSFIKLRLVGHERYAERPYKSPLGMAGAVYAIVLSTCLCISFIMDVAYGVGWGMVLGVIFSFAAIYGVFTYEFYYGLGKSKPGKERFENYLATEDQKRLRSSPVASSVDVSIKYLQSEEVSPASAVDNDIELLGLN